MITLFSDGGSRAGQDAAGALIIHLPAQPLIKAVAFLGAATNNEAEIFSGLLGLSMIHGLNANQDICWISDSEYTLKSASEYIHNWQRNGWKTAARKPVKNQGLWRTYLALSKGLKIKPQHTYGHSGHPENEACDSACNWVRDNVAMCSGLGDKVFYEPIADGLDDSSEWLVCDGRGQLAAIRAEFPSDEVFEQFFAWGKKLLS